MKQEGRYTLTPSSAVFLDRASPAYLGSAVRLLHAPSLTEAYEDLAATIRRGRIHTSEHGTTEPDHQAWVEFARSMGPMMTPAAQGAAALIQLDPSRETRVLDISASHGVFGITLVKAHPQAHLVALDWESVPAITEENAAAAGIAHQFSKITGDAFAVDLGNDYDVVLVPNFLHHFSIKQCTHVLRRIHAAFAPAAGS